MNQVYERDRGQFLLQISGLVLLVILSMLGGKSVSASPAGDDDKRSYGRIDSFPAGLIGLWVVDGVTYEANSNSEFEQLDGPFAIRKCVKVRYFDDRTPFLIDEVETQTDSDCGGNGASTPEVSSTPTGSSTPEQTSTAQSSETPAVTTTPSPESTTMVTPSSTSSSTPSNVSSSTPSSTRESDGMLEGFVIAMPSLGLAGTWIVNGTEFVANASTEYEQKDGPFVVGACVEIEFFTSSQPYVIEEIETEDLDRCSRQATPSPSGTPNSTITPAATTTPTEPASPSPTATTSGEFELFGILQSFPNTLVGTWNVGGMTFVADRITEFKQENGSFAIGSTVKIHFTVRDGVNLAREIETKFANDVGGIDDDGNGSFEGAEGHVFGVIDSLPAGLTGTWTLAGINYSANASTIYQQNDGNFVIGARAKVEYYIDGNQKRVAQKIATTSEDGGINSTGNFRLFGFVDQMPPNGITGTWIVDNIAFTSDDLTNFIESDGLVGLGAYVAIEYFIKNGQNQIHEIETHVPPGAGENQVMGEIESTGGNIAAAFVNASKATWLIAGKSYVVSPATDLNEAKGALMVGAMAQVNSYMSPTGDEIATQIRSMLFTDKVLLPLVVH